MNRVVSARTLALLGLAAASACSGGGGDATGNAGIGASSNFQVLRTTPTNGGRIFLNDPVRIDFSNRVDLDSATLSTVAFQSLDQLGNPTSELVTGNFQLDTSPGDTEPGRRLLFVPRFASTNAYDDGGFRAGRTYLVQLVGGQQNGGIALRDNTGRALTQPMTFSFTTAEGTLPSQLYRNPLPGGPAVSSITISTAPNLNEVPLNLYGAPPVEIRVRFNQALNPSDVNVPVNLDTNPLVRNIANRGRIFLEYDDPQLGANTWIPADVELEENSIGGAVVALRPVGVLPNNATVRVIVESTLEDIAGESNLANLSYRRDVGTFRTTPSYGQQFNGLVDEFITAENIDFDAPFPQPQADVGPGYLKAGFSFEGRSTNLEYEPTVREVVLNTAFTQIVPKNGLPFNVSGGVFNFRNVTIPQGVTVQGQGPNPMVWLVSGDFRVAGELSVAGGRGARVDTLNSANFAKAGGIGVCGGGNGGQGTPSATTRDQRGGTGNGPLQVPGRGGQGGRLACTSGCYTSGGYNGDGGGSGGGGGTLATQGDPWYRQPQLTGTGFQQRAGIGGAGCAGGAGTRVQQLAGGEPGALVFTDARTDNNFWGSGIDLNRNLRITGELTVPVGGGGGGGGGDTSPGFNCTATGGDPANDFSGGGGGGGGGVLIVKALGEIEITATGKINANGGHGGGGEQVGASGEAGGGGGGAGGMVILMSAKRITIHAHGTASNNRYRYADNDYNFAIQADGGVCLTGTFGSTVVADKYPAQGQTLMAGASYDANPLGGFGGMGIIQLMVPPGDNSVDGTNTRLDDNIRILRATTTGSIVDVIGTEKRQLLAWRGFPNAQGTFVDDFGSPTNIGNDEGDMRPAPTLLPVPFNAQSRLRSKWLDTGFSQRRPLAAIDGQPRGLVTANGAAVGPTFEFAGLNTASNTPGYIDYVALGTSGVAVQYPLAVAATDIAGDIDTTATFLGEPAYRVRLASPALAGDADRYSQYEAELLTATGSVVASLRILANSADELTLAPDATVQLAEARRVQVRKKFFKVVTGGSEGLGPVYVPSGGNAIPNANVRIGFAFHQNPQAATGRFPTNPQDFVYDLNDPAFLSWVQANGAPRYVQWDITFDMAFKVGNSVPPELGPNSPRPEIQFLRLPFRF